MNNSKKNKDNDLNNYSLSYLQQDLKKVHNHIGNFSQKMEPLFDSKKKKKGPLITKKAEKPRGELLQSKSYNNLKQVIDPFSKQKPPFHVLTSEAFFKAGLKRVKRLESIIAKLSEVINFFSQDFLEDDPDPNLYHAIRYLKGSLFDFEIVVQMMSEPIQ